MSRIVADNGVFPNAPCFSRDTFFVDFLFDGEQATGAILRV